MKKIVWSSVGSLLAVGGVTAAIPILSTSCTTNKIKISADKTSCNYGETIAIVANVSSKIEGELKWIYPSNLDIATFTESGAIDHNTKLWILNTNKSGEELPIKDIYAESANGKYTSNKITLSLNPLGKGYEDTIAIKPNKTSSIYGEDIIFTAIILGYQEVPAENITFSWTPKDDTSIGLEGKDEKEQRTLKITNHNWTMFAVNLAVSVTVTGSQIIADQIAHVTLQNVAVSFNTNAPSELPRRASWETSAYLVNVKDNSLPVVDYEWGGYDASSPYYRVEISGNKKDHFKITNTNNEVCNSFTFNCTLRAYADTSKTTFVSTNFDFLMVSL